MTLPRQPSQMAQTDQYMPLSLIGERRHKNLGVPDRVPLSVCCTQMNLTTLNNSVNLDTYNRNGEWHVVETGSKRIEFSYAGLPGEWFSSVAFSIQLRRRHLFYVIKKENEQHHQQR